uniref:Uncharacterized protein n=1 Tax=Anguilla anguilla TaxID=7936 RepID=A0A0E9STR6_ANGAN
MSLFKTLWHSLYIKCYSKLLKNVSANNLQSHN